MMVQCKKTSSAVDIFWFVAFDNIIIPVLKFNDSAITPALRINLIKGGGHYFVIACQFLATSDLVKDH